jgi:hypothetical protein
MQEQISNICSSLKYILTFCTDKAQFVVIYELLDCNLLTVFFPTDKIWKRR